MKFKRVEVYVYRTVNRIQKDVLHNIWEDAEVVFDPFRKPSMTVTKGGKVVGEFSWSGDFFDITEKAIVFETMLFYGISYDEFCIIKLYLEGK